MEHPSLQLPILMGDRRKEEFLQWQWKTNRKKNNHMGQINVSFAAKLTWLETLIWAKMKHFGSCVTSPFKCWPFRAQIDHFETNTETFPTFKQQKPFQCHWSVFSPNIFIRLDSNSILVLLTSCFYRQIYYCHFYLAVATAFHSQLAVRTHNSLKFGLAYQEIENLFKSRYFWSSHCLEHKTTTTHTTKQSEYHQNMKNKHLKHYHDLRWEEVAVRYWEQTEMGTITGCIYLSNVVPKYSLEVPQGSNL